MKNVTGRPTVIALAIITACCPLATRLRAQDQNAQQPSDQPQTVAEATALLTTGEWRFHGVSRTFHPDGTFTSQNANVGTWAITEDQLEITLGALKFRFFLPLDPKGTRGEQEKKRKDTKELLIQVPK